MRKASRESSVAQESFHDHRTEPQRFSFYSQSGAAALALDPAAAASSPQPQAIKPITGSWFEFQHHSTVEGVDWNPACDRFTAAQWDAKIKEIADAGLEYLVLMTTALYYRAFYDTKIFPKWQLACADPLEAVLSAADNTMSSFLSEPDSMATGPATPPSQTPSPRRRDSNPSKRLPTSYGHHPSFYGWYWPDEAEINPYYTPEFIHYVNDLSHEARQLKPQAQIMIAPYGTRIVTPDDKYVRQLDTLDVDIVGLPG